MPKAAKPWSLTRLRDKSIKIGAKVVVERLLAEYEPDVVGLSVMTFQRKTAKGVASATNYSGLKVEGMKA